MVDGWMGKGRWQMGKSILSKQEDKGDKWKVDEKWNSKCPIRPMQWVNRGNGSKCSDAWLLILESGRDAIRRRPWGRSRALQLTRLVIVVFPFWRYRREPPFMDFNPFFRCGTHHYRGWRLRQPSRFRRIQWRRSLHSMRHAGRRRSG